MILFNVLINIGLSLAGCYIAQKNASSIFLTKLVDWVSIEKIDEKAICLYPMRQIVLLGADIQNATSG